MRKILEFYCDYSEEVSSCYPYKAALEEMCDLIDDFYNFCVKLVGRDNITYYEDSKWATMYIDVSDFDKAVINRLLSGYKRFQEKAQDIIDAYTE